jgi:hypothetical protein
MKVFYDKDCDLSLIKGKTVAIIGYGSQGHAHAQNLNDSGVKVVVGLRKGGASWDKVGKAGLTVMEVNDAVKAADVVMILLPDEQIAEVYKNNVSPTSSKVLRWPSPTASTCTTTRSCPAPTWTCGWSPQGSRPHRAQHLHPRWRRAPPGGCAPGQVRQGP